MKIETLHSIDEVLHYGSLGEVEIITGEDWSYLEDLIEKYLDEDTPEGDTELDSAYDSGLNDGYHEGRSDGYEECLCKYGIEED